MHAMASLENNEEHFGVSIRKKIDSVSLCMVLGICNASPLPGPKKMFEPQKYVRKAGCQNSLFEKLLRRRVC